MIQIVLDEIFLMNFPFVLELTIKMFHKWNKHLLISGASISFDTVLLWADISSIFMGFTVFFAVVQFMELLALNRHISMLSSTLKVYHTNIFLNLYHGY